MRMGKCFKQMQFAYSVRRFALLCFPKPLIKASHFEQLPVTPGFHNSACGKDHDQICV